LFYFSASLHLFYTQLSFQDFALLIAKPLGTLAFFYRTLGTSTLYSEHTWALPVDALLYASDHLWTLM
jgi:hypothetical protein